MFKTISFLSTVSPFATAHMFCASRDDPGSLGRHLLIQRYFCAVYSYAGKQDLGKGYEDPKRIFGGNHAFFRDN